MKDSIEIDDLKHEKRRTVILVVLLFVALGFIYYVQNNVSSNFEDQFDDEESTVLE